MRRLRAALSWARRRRVPIVLALALGATAAGPTVALAGLDVSEFSLTASTTRAKAHPNITVTTSFGDTGAGLRDIALHLPAGLGANPRAVPYCSRKRLLADLCPAASRVGTLTVTGEAFGLDVTASNAIHNVRARGGERLRLAVPIVGSISRPGIAAELPVTERHTERPADRGLDMAVTGLPSDVNGVRVRIKRVVLALRGVVRVRLKGKRQKRAFLTNPSSCGPAPATLEVTSHDVPAASVTRTAAFAPTGCAPS